MVRLRRRALVAPESYPRFTLLLQSLGSASLALEGLRQAVPEVLPSPFPLPPSYPRFTLLLQSLGPPASPPLRQPKP